MDDIQRKQKSHSKRQSGAKVVKKKGKVTKGKNAKAFAVQHVNKAARTVRRALDLEEKKHHIPVADRCLVDKPPVIVAVVGPRGVGKSTLITCLVKKLSGQRVREIRGPITVVAGKKRRLTFIEVSSDVNAMLDAAKVADLIILLVDAQFGKIEMETFEFTQIVKIHPGQKVIGVMNHLDQLKEKKSLKKLKKRLKKRFWDEVYAGAKLFYLAHFLRGEYIKREVENLVRFISIMKYRPAEWRQTHSYILVDRVEDITPVEMVKENSKIDRTISLWGFVRGAHLFAGTNVHIPGCGDFVLDNINFHDDPCPVPGAKKRRTLLDKERKLYAPMSGVGDILMDRGGVYVNIRGKKGPMNAKELKAVIPPAGTYDSDEELGDNGIEMMETDGALEENGFSEEDIDKSDQESTDEDDDQESDDEDDDQESDEVEEEDDDEEGDDDDDDDSNIFSNDDAKEEEFGWDHTEAVRRGNGDVKPSSLIGDVETMKGAFEELAMKWKPVEVGRINWNQHVYGKRKKGKVQKQEEEEEEEDVLFGSLLRVTRDEENQEDYTIIQTTPQDKSMLDEAAWKLLTDRFVTGTWDENEDAQKLLDADDAAQRKMSNESGSEDSEEASDADSKEDEESDDDDDPAAKIVVKDRDRKTLKAEKREKYLKKKKRQREAFEASYEAAKSAHGNDGSNDYYMKWREEVESRARVSDLQFANLEDDIRVQLEGYRAGMYVSIEIKGVSHRFIDHFDPCYPLIVGSLLASEETLGYVRCNFKLHRWYGRILKSGDPLHLSIGWRRYQSVVNYSVQDHNARHRFIKYTPKHQHCYAVFYGPQAPKGTGILAYPDSRTPMDKFRICGTGGVEENDQHIDLKKKLKLCGTPYKIFKKTAFVKGMFNTTLEASKLVGAKVQTVSGIRGIIKKVLSEASGLPLGTVRVSFEDKIRSSDIVFCRCWAPVEIPPYYNIITNLLLPRDDSGERAKWQGLRTMGQLRHDLGLKTPDNENSHYRGVARRPYVEAQLYMPTRLQSRLPYRDKPRNKAAEVDRVQASRPPVIREPEEERRRNLLTMVEAVATESAKRRRQNNAKNALVLSNKIVRP